MQLQCWGQPQGHTCKVILSSVVLASTTLQGGAPSLPQLSSYLFRVCSAASLSGLAIPITPHPKVQTGNLFSLDSHGTGLCPGIESSFLSFLSSPLPPPHKILAPCLSLSLKLLLFPAALSVASPGMGPLAEGFGEPSRKDHTEPYRVSQWSGRGCWEPGAREATESYTQATLTRGSDFRALSGCPASFGYGHSLAPSQSVLSSRAPERAGFKKTRSPVCCDHRLWSCWTLVLTRARQVICDVTLWSSAAFSGL